MKFFFYILAIILSIGCNQSEKPKKRISKIDTTITKKVVQKEKKQIQYSDQQLEAFLDSIGTLSPKLWMNKVSFTTDSIFKNQQQEDQLISPSDFAKLKIACKTENLDFKTAKKIFKDFHVDSSYLKEMDSLPITFISFDNSKFTFNEFAISPGYTDLKWDCELYFFKSNRIISKHNIFHRYGLDLEHFRDVDGKTVIYYKENYQSGSGIWWFNYYFYKYYNTKLIPILNELENANLQYPSPWGLRGLWLESFIQKTNPLTIKMVYYQEFPDTAGELHKIIDDSTIIKYNWDEQSKTLKGAYKNSKISKPKILAYYLEDNELLFINSYYQTLKKCFQKNDLKKREATLDYLKEVKNHCDNN